jgi:polyhydroxybutyrate depolymerase
MGARRRGTWVSPRLLRFVRPVRGVTFGLLLLVLVGPSAPAMFSTSTDVSCAGARLDAEDSDQAQHLIGTVWRTVRVGDGLRSYLLSRPPTGSAPAPLLVAFHGLHQRADCFGAATGLVPATRAAGVVLALPESSGPAFNDGRLGTTGPDDDAFTLALVHQLVIARVADARRVVVAGFSNGAGMAMEVAAVHPRTVAAVVSIGGSLIDAPGAARPTGSVPAYLVHGDADRVQPWQGRRSAGPLWPAYISVPATVAEWVRVDESGPPVVDYLAGGPGRPDVTVSTWSPGPSGAGVTSYAVVGMGHVWPTTAADAVDATSLVTRVTATAGGGTSARSGG